MFSFKGFLVGITQLVNGSLSGDPDTPFSARAAYEAESGHHGWVAMEAILDLVFAVLFGERDHCRNSLAGPNSDMNLPRKGKK